MQFNSFRHFALAYVPFMTYCRELLMASPTTRDYAHKTKAYAEQRNAEEIERAAAWAWTLRERFEVVCDDADSAVVDFGVWGPPGATLTLATPQPLIRKVPRGAP